MGLSAWVPLDEPKASGWGHAGVFKRMGLGLGRGSRSWNTVRQMPAPGEPESQQRREQPHGARSKKLLEALGEFPALSPAVYLVPSFYS